MKDVIILSKWIAIIFISLVIIFCAILASRYRLSVSSETVKITDEVIYKFIDMDFSLRTLFERSLRNEKVRLKNGSELYISNTDKKRLWHKNPHDMAKENSHYVVTFETRTLLFGGYGKARITAIEQAAGAPIIRK